MSRIHLNSHTVALWLSMAVAAAGAVGAGCSSSSGSDDSAAGASAGKTGGAGKSGDSGGDTSVPSEGGAAGTATDTPAGGDTSTPSGGGPTAEAGAGGSTPDATGEAGAGGGGGTTVVVDPTAAAVARAKKLVAGLPMPCVMCHQPNYAGANYWPNITPDMDTGIGSWSDDDIKKAITKGMGPDGEVFCAEMQHFAFTDSQLSDVVTYLHSLTPVSKSITKKCPN